MKKRILIIATLVVAAMAFTGCGNGSGSKKAGSGQAEVALITDSGNIDDGSFNQGTYEGIKAYCDKNNKTYGYYKPSGEAKEDQIQQIDLAISNGAKVIITPGFSFANTIEVLQNDSKYKDIQFLLIDSVPADEKGNPTTIQSNVHCINYMEEQAGYLAGYAAVKDGMTKLGFLGGQSIPPVARYGYGFVQGANAAAVELKKTADVEINYWYCGSFSPNDDINTKMTGWYTSGTEAIFACGGKIYQSVTKAAEPANKKVIGVDTDQAKESQTIITSALKGIATSVTMALEELYKNGGKWPATLGGQSTTLGAADDCVGLPTESSSWRFSTFTVDDYKKLFEDVKSGKVTISNDVSKEPTVQIKVNYEK